MRNDQLRHGQLGSFGDFLGILPPVDLARERYGIFVRRQAVGHHRRNEVDNRPMAVARIGSQCDGSPWPNSEVNGLSMTKVIRCQNARRNENHIS